MPNGLFFDHSQWFSTSYVNLSKVGFITVAAAGVGYAGGIAGVNKNHKYSILLTKKNRAHLDSAFAWPAT
jgi:hypothetical protein